MSQILDNKSPEVISPSPIKVEIEEKKKSADKFRFTAICVGAVSLVNAAAAAISINNAINDIRENIEPGNPAWTVGNAVSAVVLGTASNLLFAESRFKSNVAANLEAHNTIQKLS